MSRPPIPLHITAAVSVLLARCLPPARLIAALGRPCTSVRRRLAKLTHLGLIVRAVISGRRAYLPAPWVLA